MTAADGPDFTDGVQWTAIDGLRIRFIEEAALKGPDILVLSPWPEGLATYRDSWPLLTAAGRVVALDLPGFGASEGRSDLASPRTMAGFLMKVIERFRLSHPHLVALGIWWTLAAEVSVAEPGALESLIVGRDLLAGDFDAPPSSRRPSRGELERGVRAALAGSHVPEARRGQILREFSGSKFQLVAAYVRAHRAGARAAAAALSSLQRPVLTIEGGKNWTAIGATSNLIGKSAPRTRDKAESRSSFVWMEEPEVFGRLVADWVAGGYRRSGGLSIARVRTRGARNETGGDHNRRP